eukprot:517946-Prymnesium_polylepis.1
MVFFNTQSVDERVSVFAILPPGLVGSKNSVLPSLWHRKHAHSNQRYPLTREAADRSSAACVPVLVAHAP